jgi:hypothetical protein
MHIIDAAALKTYKKKFNFFATPDKIATFMSSFLGLGRGALIIDPSAGTGVLLRAADVEIPFEKSLHYCEVQPEFDQYLTAYTKVGTDFLAYNPGPIYDAVIMNPPYKNGADKIHIDHAWDCIKPGGRIICLVSINTATRIDDEYEGHVFERHEYKKAFKETSITVVMFLIFKPLYC